MEPDLRDGVLRALSALLFAAKKIGWKTLVGASYLLAYLVIAHQAHRHPVHGIRQQPELGSGPARLATGLRHCPEFQSERQHAPSPGVYGCFGAQSSACRFSAPIYGGISPG